MPIDANRAAFVKQDYRYEIAEDPSIKVTYTQAREVVLDANLSVTDANTLATAYFNAIKHPTLAFSVDVEHVYNLEDIDGSPPTFTLNFTDFATDLRTFNTAVLEVDYLAGRSTLTVRG